MQLKGNQNFLIHNQRNEKQTTRHQTQKQI